MINRTEIRKDGGRIDDCTDKVIIYKGRLARKKKLRRYYNGYYNVLEYIGCKESNATLQSTSNSLENIYISILFDYIVALILHDVR